MTALLDRKLLFVTGKGGVGKSTIAASLGLLAAEQGKRTLVCEVDAKGNLADFYEAGPTSFAARELQPDLFAMSMDTEESLKEYLSLQLKIPLLAKIGPLARTFDFIANAAPGVKEILTIGKLAWEVKERHYDLVVVDSVASGHIVGQLTAPQGINELVQVGMVRNQTQWMLDILHDPRQTGVVIVSAPEEMPVAETIELADRLEAETEVDLAAVVVNRVLPELFTEREEALFEALRTPKRIDALTTAVGGDVTPVFDAAELAVTLRRTRAEHLATLRDGLDPAIPLVYVRTSVRPQPRRPGHPPGGRGCSPRALMAPQAPRPNGPARSSSCCAAKEIVISCGSAAWARPRRRRPITAMAATHLGGKVLVLTVDPAKRLASALGLERTRQHRDPGSAVGLRSGRRDAAPASVGGDARHQAGWDDLVRAAPDAKTREAILANSIYQNISGRFVQSRFIAMERLYEIPPAGTYDLIVVDTRPPAAPSTPRGARPGWPTSSARSCCAG
ncbi:MAG: ArsA family ATPase [Acidimicrobiales bacterium]